MKKVTWLFIWQLFFNHVFNTGLEFLLCKINVLHIFVMLDFFHIFGISPSHEILIESNFRFGFYIWCILNSRNFQSCSIFSMCENAKTVLIHGCKKFIVIGTCSGHELFLVGKLQCATLETIWNIRILKIFFTRRSTL